MDSQGKAALNHLGIVLPDQTSVFSDVLTLAEIPLDKVPNPDRVDPRNFLVVHPLGYTSQACTSTPGQHFTATVLNGERTDLASVPKPYNWLVPSYGRYSKAAVLHDHLCSEARKLPTHDLDQRRRRADRRFEADLHFRVAMQETGVPWLRRWFMWAAVEWATILTTRPLWLLPLAGIVVPLVLLLWRAVVAVAAAATRLLSPWDVSWSLLTRVPARGLLVVLLVSVVLLVLLGRRSLNLVVRSVAVCVLTAVGAPFLLMGLPVAVAIVVFFVVEWCTYALSLVIRRVVRVVSATTWPNPVNRPEGRSPFR